MSPELQFALLTLAVWRLTHLLTAEDGPGDLVLRLRRRLGNGGLGRAFDCFYCLSVWIAAPAALLPARDLLSWGLTWLALSGAACLLERGTATRESPSEPLATHSLHRRELDGMLWSGTSGASSGGGGSVDAAGQPPTASPEPAAGQLPR